MPQQLQLVVAYMFVGWWVKEGHTELLDVPEINSMSLCLLVLPEPVPQAVLILPAARGRRSPHLDRLTCDLMEGIQTGGPEDLGYVPGLPLKSCRALGQSLYCSRWTKDRTHWCVMFRLGTVALPKWSLNCTDYLGWSKLWTNKTWGPKPWVGTRAGGGEDASPPTSGEGEAGGKGCVGHPEAHPPGLKTAHVGSWLEGRLPMKGLITLDLSHQALQCK